MLNELNMNVFGIWMEAKVPEGNPHKHKENMQIPRTKYSNKLQDCEADVLITHPLRLSCRH